MARGGLLVLILGASLAAVSAQTLPIINIDPSKVFQLKPPGFTLPGTPVISGITDQLTCNVAYKGGPVLYNNPKVYYIFYVGAEKRRVWSGMMVLHGFLACMTHHRILQPQIPQPLHFSAFQWKLLRLPATLHHTP
jgi:hypothetical protein